MAFQGPTPTERRITVPDGTVLSVHAWTGPPPRLGTVVLVHGLKDHALRYDEFARSLTSAGFDVVAPDLRGHGASGGDRQWVAKFGTYVDDLDAAVRTIGATGSGERPFLLGHSMGGAVALRYLLERRGDLRGLVLSGPALRPPASVGAGARAATRLLGVLAPRSRIFRMRPEDFSRDPATVAAIRADPRIDPSPAPARTARELLRTMAWAEARFAEVTVPVVAFHGLEDRLTDPDGSAALVRAAAAEDKSFRGVPGLYHDLLHEPERAVVAGEMVGWLVDHARA